MLTLQGCDSKDTFLGASFTIRFQRGDACALFFPGEGLLHSGHTEVLDKTSAITLFRIPQIVRSRISTRQVGNAQAIQ